MGALLMVYRGKNLSAHPWGSLKVCVTDFPYDQNNPPHESINTCKRIRPFGVDRVAHWLADLSRLSAGAKQATQRRKLGTAKKRANLPDRGSKSISGVAMRCTSQYRRMLA
jgi:hypothetical protein